MRYECTTLPLYVTEIATSYCTVTAWHDGSTGQGTQDTMAFPQIRAGKGANPQVERWPQHAASWEGRLCKSRNPSHHAVAKEVGNVVIGGRDGGMEMRLTGMADAPVSGGMMAREPCPKNRPGIAQE